MVGTSEWRAVPGFPGFMVNDVGCLRGPSGRILKLQSQPKTGHLFVQTRSNRSARPRKLWAHRAVLFAFVGKPQPGQESRHLNDFPTDNRVSNLTWGTHTENARDRRLNGGYRRDVWASVTILSKDDVAAVQSSLLSSRKLAAQYGVSHTTILELKRQAKVGS